MRREIFIRKIADEIADGNLAIFAGAGLSVASGGVTWSNLLKDAADELGLDIEREGDLISLTQFYVNSKNNNRGGLAQHIYNKLNLRDAAPNINHEILARMPITDYWTTNYDNLIETALERENKLPDVKSDVSQFLRTVRGRDAIVYKMHGDIENPNRVIITRRDFESYHETHTQFINTLYGDLTTKTFLFVGLSFTDPNLFYVLSRVRVKYELDQREHYAVIKKFSEEDFKTKDEFDYANVRQELFIKDLVNYNISVFLIDEHKDLTELLREIERRYKRNAIFLSGSAHEYGIHTVEDAAQILEFVIDNQFKNKRRIINGYGLGFGDLVIGAAVRKIANTPFRSLQDYITIRPFPQQTPQGEDLGKLWTSYRKDMISRAGIAVFMYGNKLKDGLTIDANGVYEEFQICRENGVIVVPVGATGFITQKIWQEVDRNFEEYYGSQPQSFRDAFSSLNDSGTPEEIAQRVNKFIGMISERSL
ncbi:SIR2 family protein [Deinococcus taklimakanensis]|uniref:NAD(+) hydrolase ThsA n=1 Tax=Deinococcus taklimakanensis TaxID=536443 RepID=A0ABW5P141_9DEIO